jgi:hypothetical protein
MYTIPTGIKTNIKFSENVEGVKLEEKSILQNCPFYIFIGPPRSGKTTIIEEMLNNKELYFKKFNKVLFISPSSFGDIDLVVGENWYPTLNLSWIYEELSKLQNKESTKQVLIIFDDCVSEMNKLNNVPDFTKLFYNRRHILPNVCVSIFLTTQYWVKIPSCLRSIGTGLFIFKVNQTEWSKITKELTIQDNSHILKTVVSTLGSKPFTFLYLNFINNKYYLNFESQIII